MQTLLCKRSQTHWYPCFFVRTFYDIWCSCLQAFVSWRIQFSSTCFYPFCRKNWHTSVISGRVVTLIPNQTCLIEGKLTATALLRTRLLSKSTPLQVKALWSTYNKKNVQSSLNRIRKPFHPGDHDLLIISSKSARWRRCDVLLAKDVWVGSL